MHLVSDLSTALMQTGEIALDTPEERALGLYMLQFSEASIFNYYIGRLLHKK